MIQTLLKCDNRLAYYIIRLFTNTKNLFLANIIKLYIVNVLYIVIVNLQVISVPQQNQMGL